MKTYKGKKISKKHIQNVLRTMDRTQIFRLYLQIYGFIDRSGIYAFINKFAPTNSVYLAAYSLAFGREERDYSMDQDGKSWQYQQANKYHIAMDWFRYYINNQNNPYSKRPIIHGSYLFFVSPIYGMDDYNRWKCMPIAGNERFCETICKLADKYFPTHEQQ